MQCVAPTPLLLLLLIMRTRLYGGVGAGGENPPATRLYLAFVLRLTVAKRANAYIRQYQVIFCPV